MELPDNYLFMRKRKPGRPKIHTNITVSVMTDYNGYFRQYRKKVMKKRRGENMSKKSKSRKKKDPLPMGKLFTDADKDPWRL